MSETVTVEERIIEILAEKLDKRKEEIGADADLQKDLGADSLDAVEILMDIEDAFDVTIPEEDAQNLKTAKQIIDYVKKKL